MGFHIHSPVRRLGGITTLWPTYRSRPSEISAINFYPFSTLSYVSSTSYSGEYLRMLTFYSEVNLLPNLFCLLFFMHDLFITQDPNMSGLNIYNNFAGHTFILIQSTESI